MEKYVAIALAIACIILSVTVRIQHDTAINNKMLIMGYEQQISALKADANLRAARDKAAQIEANATVKQSEKDGDKVLADTVPTKCEDIRQWAIKQAAAL